MELDRPVTGQILALQENMHRSASHLGKVQGYRFDTLPLNLLVLVKVYGEAIIRIVHPQNLHRYQVDFNVLTVHCSDIDTL